MRLVPHMLHLQRPSPLLPPTYYIQCFKTPANNDRSLPSLRVGPMRRGTQQFRTPHHQVGCDQGETGLEKGVGYVDQSIVRH